MDFIVMIKYQEGSSRLLDELDNTEEKTTGHLGHGTLICPSTSQASNPSGRPTSEQWIRKVGPLFSWPMVAAHAVAIDNQYGSGGARDASCGRRGSEAHIWIAAWEGK